MPLYPPFWSPFLKMATISKVTCLILETLRHRIITLVSTHIIYGQYNSDNVGLRAPHKVCIVGLPVVAIFCK